jgi:hypothetical protein
MESDSSKKGLGAAEVALMQRVARRIMASSPTPQVSRNSLGPRYARAIAILRKYGIK